MSEAVRLSDFLKNPEWKDNWKNSGYLSERTKQSAVALLARLHEDIISRMEKGEISYRPENVFIFNYAVASEENDNQLLISQLYTDENEKHNSFKDIWSSSVIRLQMEIIDEVIYIEGSKMHVGNENVLVAECLSEVLDYFNNAANLHIPKEGVNKIPLSEIVDMEPTADLILSLWHNLDNEKHEKFLDVGRWMLNRISSLVKYAMGKDSPNRFDPKNTYLMFNVKDWYGKYVPRIGIMDMKTDKPLFAIIPYDLTDSVNPLCGIVASAENNFSKPIVKGTWTQIRAYFGWKDPVYEE